MAEGTTVDAAQVAADEKAEKVKTYIKYAVIAAVVIFVAWFVYKKFIR